MGLSDTGGLSSGGLSSGGLQSGGLTGGADKAAMDQAKMEERFHRVEAGDGVTSTGEITARHIRPMRADSERRQLLNPKFPFQIFPITKDGDGTPMAVVVAGTIRGIEPTPVGNSTPPVTPPYPIIGAWRITASKPFMVKCRRLGTGLPKNGNIGTEVVMWYGDLSDDADHDPKKWFVFSIGAVGLVGGRAQCHNTITHSLWHNWCKSMGDMLGAV